MSSRPISVAILVCLLSSTLVHADDLGIVGPTYEIIERDLIEVIKDKFRRKQKNGELARMQADYQRQVVGGIEHPRPVAGIRPTETSRTFYIDPSWTLDRNVVDKKGNLLFPAGTRINPLDYDHMTRTLLFFDGRDKKQLAYAKRLIAELKTVVKPILVAGEPMKLMREWKLEVFYDQGGSLSRRFSITQSPAVVRQEGKRLRVDEIRL